MDYGLRSRADRRQSETRSFRVLQSIASRCQKSFGQRLYTSDELSSLLQRDM